jgi:hypothetical protein
VGAGQLPSGCQVEAGVRIVTTSSAEEGEKGPDGVHTPDGRPIGTVTAFCRGQTVCPDWVNNL